MKDENKKEEKKRCEDYVEWEYFDGYGYGR